MRISDNLRPHQLDDAHAEWRALRDKITEQLTNDTAQDDAEKFHGLLDEFWERTLQIIESKCVSYSSAANMADLARSLKYHPNTPELWYA